MLSARYPVADFFVATFVLQPASAMFSIAFLLVFAVAVLGGGLRGAVYRRFVRKSPSLFQHKIVVRFRFQGFDMFSSFAPVTYCK